MQFLKVQSVSLLLGATGKAEIKIESEETFLNLSYFLQSNAASSVGCYYSRREPAQKEKACLHKLFFNMDSSLILYHV